MSKAHKNSVRLIRIVFGMVCVGILATCVTISRGENQAKIDTSSYIIPLKSAPIDGCAVLNVSVVPISHYIENYGVIATINCSNANFSREITFDITPPPIKFAEDDSKLDDQYTNWVNSDTVINSFEAIMSNGLLSLPVKMDAKKNTLLIEIEMSQDTELKFTIRPEVVQKYLDAIIELASHELNSLTKEANATSAEWDSLKVKA
ncbi:hypothetical protein LMH73_025520 [Vibrio splendidus]|nr:hypothetical protein [Vibrio splendidus]MCC4881875.1 hypothetical protein [Vibrio splendidus]